MKACLPRLHTGSPCFFYYVPGGDEQLAFRQSWTLISVFLVFPLTMTMTSAFNRREMALVQLSTLKSNLMCIFLAHSHWDWYTIPKDPSQPASSGRGSRLPPDHVRQVHGEISSLIRTLKSSLRAPIVSRARHTYTAAGRRQRKLVMQHASLLHERMALQMKHLSLLAEEMKRAGLPANEATRIRQHFVNAINALMQVRGWALLGTQTGEKISWGG